MERFSLQCHTDRCLTLKSVLCINMNIVCVFQVHFSLGFVLTPVVTNAAMLSLVINMSGRKKNWRQSVNSFSYLSSTNVKSMLVSVSYKDLLFFLSSMIVNEEFGQNKQLEDAMFTDVHECLFRCWYYKYHFIL